MYIEIGMLKNENWITPAILLLTISRPIYSKYRYVFLLLNTKTLPRRLTLDYPSILPFGYMILLPSCIVLL